MDGRGERFHGNRCTRRRLQRSDPRDAVQPGTRGTFFQSLGALVSRLRELICAPSAHFGRHQTDDASRSCFYACTFSFVLNMNMAEQQGTVIKQCLHSVL